MFFIFFVFIFAAFSMGRNFISPEELLVATVLDPSNQEVLRDSLTLIRTFRAFGGELSRATFLVCICVDLMVPFYDEGNIIRSLLDLQVEITFIDQVPHPLPKTLNKFTAFKKFDFKKFDYFLWLDADIVVFDDPMILLEKHRRFGEIKCVPDLYNYMLRFPHVKGSELVENSALSHFHLLGAGEDAPHGLCNTGVLLFDHLSLSNFLHELPIAIENLNKINKFKYDRFLDSLIFVSIVNTKNIHVHIMGFEMNYMAMFEVEILHETVTTNHIYFAHFLSNTSLYCFESIQDNNESLSSSSSSCGCTYHNKFIPEYSILVKQLQTMVTNHTKCQSMTGIKMNSIALKSLIDKTNQQYDSIDITLYSTNNTIRNNDIKEINRNYTNNINEMDAIDDDNNSNRNWILNWPLNESILYYSSNKINLLLSINRPINNNNELMNELNSKEELLTISLIVTDIKNNSNLVANMTSSVNILSSNHLLNFNMELYTNILYSVPMTYFNISLELILYNEIKLKKYFIVQVFYTPLLPSGLTKYSINPLFGIKPISLQSQLLLPTYLNNWKLNGIGLVVCCETYKGIEVVQNLLTQWDGNILIILVVSVPSDQKMNTEKNRKKVLSDLFNLRCSQHDVHVRCVISMESEERFASSYYSNQLSFIYTDVFVSYHHYSLQLHLWYNALNFNGLFIGSRYILDPGIYSDSDKGIFIRPAVDKFLTEKSLAVLATYDEAYHVTNSNRARSYIETCPAWYFFKLK